MAENDAAAASAQAVPPPQAAHPPFPAVRLLYAFAYSILAWFVFWIVLLLAAVQFVTILVNGKFNEELRHFSVNLVQYLWELLAFITFVRDDQPFPIGPFPKRAPS
jgi:Domain of unknown function (DUF4389)